MAECPICKSTIKATPIGSKTVGIQCNCNGNVERYLINSGTVDGTISEYIDKFSKTTHPPTPEPTPEPTPQPTPEPQTLSTPPSVLTETQRILTSKDPYVILGILQGASESEIKTEYRKLFKKYDPNFGLMNRTKSEQETLEKIAMQLNWAKEQLKRK